MAKKKADRGKFLKLDIIKNKCKDCGKDYEANKMIYEKGEVITPPRCGPCQTAHLTNLRVAKTTKSIQLLGNLRTRLSTVQREAVVEAITAEMNTLLDRYSGSTVKASAFDLKKVKA